MREAGMGGVPSGTQRRRQGGAQKAGLARAACEGTPHVRGWAELAGKGIEYSWGKAKRDFRQHNDCVPKNLHKNVQKSFESLPLGRVRKFARKTREYMRAYAKSHMLFGATEADKLEGYHAVKKFVKASKTHRCTLDQDYAFVGTA